MWIASNVTCEVCQHKWVEVRPATVMYTECPYCGLIVYAWFNNGQYDRET